MLSHAFRFHGHGSLKYLYTHGKSVRGRSLVVKYVDNPRRKISRYAVVVSKKVHKSAVGRNRIRRRIYAVLREEYQKLKTPYDIVIIVTVSDIRTMPIDELRAQLTSLFASASLYK